MATLTHSQSKRLYSWWWDSHISPKSSKWLEENLSDMDSKVKAMIKLIEVDADTFAKRAEMFYKKRPELLKLVEEFYRTYRALAEKYSSATGVLRQAHSTMVEVCPDHVPFELPDDSPGNSLETDDPHTPQVPIQSRASFYPNVLQKDGLEFSSPGFHSVSSGVYTEDKQFIDNVLGSEREVRKGLDFDAADEKDQALTESAVVVKFEKDIQVLKDTLAKLDAEKAAGLANFQQSLERLSKLESEVCQAQEDSKRVDGQAKKAESEVEILKKALYKLEAEKNASFLHYQNSLERFSKLETVVSLAQAESKRVDEQTCKAYGEVQTLKEALYKLEAEKEFSFHGYQWSLERLSKLESDLYHAQEDYKRVDERAKSAEDEVETLKEALKKLEAEKEVSLLQYQQCLARIAHLESDSSHSQENAQELSERAHKAEAEAQSLKKVLSNLESEKDEIEKKLQIAQEDGRKHIERALTAEEQVETLKHTLHKLTEEKEAAFFQYQQCLESISSLEEKLSTAQDEVQKVNGEVQRVVEKLYNVEERRLVLEELCESQNQKLTEKQKEMDVEKQEHSSLTQKNEQTIVLLEERCRSMKKEMDESSNYQLQMPVLQGYIRELLKILREQGQKEEALVNEKLNLEKVVVDLKKELEEINMIRHEREMQILKLSENNHSLSMENEGFNELFGACRSHKDGIFSGESRVQVLQERISSLEGENKSLKCQSAVCAQAIISLKDSISSLEKSTCLQTRFQKTRDKGAKGEDASSRSSSESLKAMSPDQQGPDMVSEVKDLLRRLTAAEKVVIKIKKIAAKECIEANTKLESAIKLMEELKISRCSNPEESSESGSLMKDIVLDKVSQTLSRQIRRSQSEDTEYLLESWDTSLDRSIGLTVGKGKRKSVSDRVEGHRRYSSKVGSIEELTGDKSDFSTTPSLPRQEANKRKILDRLNSDYLKLSNLKITVQDLAKRVDRNKKNKNHDEWDTLKDQLEEAEESIQKLSDVQSKLKRSAEEKSAMAADESGAFRRRRIAEKAKRVSEKIGRLQLEVQKMQFLLLKLDDETDKGKKVKSRVVESKKKVLLRDYLYGSGGRSSFRKKKKAACCGFVQPSTKED